PKGNDGVQNGDESGVDCGGSTTGAPRCSAGVACLVHDDCASNGCSFDHKCALKRSCTPPLGGATCGTGEVGSANANHESCCATAKLSGSSVMMNKYHVTAGRMRAFIERLNGNVRAFAKTTAGWNTDWDGFVPSTPAEADIMLGSFWNGASNDTNGDNSKRSCGPGSFGGHTYFTPPNLSNPSQPDFSDFSQADLDVKALNCVGWHLARAFCSWDGGRLPTLAEIIDAFKNGGTTTYPWGNAGYDPVEPDNRLNHRFNYRYPNVPGRRLLQNGDAADIAWHVSPPGRFALGANAKGIEIAGNLLHWVNDAEYGFTETSSWERHDATLGQGNWKDAWPGEPNGYYAVGFRCVYD
ncbi:MAG TPA: SUMF1/EgtB/PvdO family nonheme iron enzyme, partial [Labilithrix sp.]|nr:SUMF1/EgtB/PvdO family nonheme iron enzyme [Labilithrix sp.]